MRSLGRILFVAFFVAVAPSPAADVLSDPLERGHDHYFNLEYPEAIRAYYQALETHGESAKIWNHIATAILYQELNRLGKLETSAFRGDNSFLDQEKPRPDPAENERFLNALGYARKLAEQRLGEAPKDRGALLSLSQNYGLEANYLFMIDKSYLAALRAGNKARKYSNDLQELYPDFVDPYLVAGVQEYVVGSLPWAVRALIAIGGVRGNKQKGQEWVTRVADEGESLRTEARVLMTLLHRRENRPLEAAKLLGELIVQFPRNYVLHLERGSMLLDAGERDAALRVFRNARGKVENDEDRFARMPARLREALDRKIKEIAEADDPSPVAARPPLAAARG